MLKIVCIFALVLVATCEAQRCRPVCNPKVRSPAICAADNQQKECFRMSQCQLDEENCRRKAARRPTISNVDPIRCRNIRAPNGKGKCAPPPRRPRSTKPDCNRLKCRNPSKVLRCYRCKKNMCQLLTPCQLERVNCLRGRSNRLTWTDTRRCAGMKGGQKLQRCKAIRKKSG
ncbi:uncharacterized protein LOC133336984 [Musca vetustissima]|uniref:uncharacterized protein LOC133330884 n=1 Tax=Musca vetustissima TaxID=27455 RepID=UPI002AB65E15|nr:uncharacterized protein LOC133330884 [Musca vetustissima]XP_061401230.1 uncharacterized protein LOC133336984 [Musca vetustissima]